MSKNAKMTNPMKVITGPNTRWSYVNVWEPKSINGGTPKYSISLIIPKSDAKTVTKIEAAIETEVLTIYRKFVMVSLLVVRHLLSLISHLMKMTISLINGGDHYGNVTGYSNNRTSYNLARVQCSVPYLCNPELQL